MMVEGEVTAGSIRKVGSDILGSDVDGSILHILRMGELDVLNLVEHLQQYGAHQTIEITACYQSKSVCHHLRSLTHHGCDAVSATSQEVDSRFAFQTV